MKVMVIRSIIDIDFASRVNKNKDPVKKYPTFTREEVSKFLESFTLLIKHMTVMIYLAGQHQNMGGRAFLTFSTLTPVQRKKILLF